MSFVFARAGSNRPTRVIASILSAARRIRTMVAARQRPRTVRDLPLSNHLRRDIGLDPLTRDPFGR
jgi:hypothetical protein